MKILELKLSMAWQVEGFAWKGMISLYFCSPPLNSYPEDVLVMSSFNHNASLQLYCPWLYKYSFDL